MEKKMNGYELTNGWFEFLKNNVSRVNTNHSALYNYIVHKANKLGWPSEFGLPSEDTMHNSGFKTYKTYKKTLDDLIEFGVIEQITEAKNQHTSTVIALVILTKAKPKHSRKQDQCTIQSTVESKTKAEPTYINNKTSINCLNHETIKPLGTVKTLNGNKLSSVEEIEQWCISNNREISNSIDGIIKYHDNYLSMSIDDKITTLMTYSKELQPS